MNFTKPRQSLAKNKSMRKRLIILSIIFSLFTSLAHSQNQEGTIRGTVTDAKTKETLGFASVELYDNDVRKVGTSTDVDGNYEFKGLTAGNNYSIKVSFIGYNEQKITGIDVKINAETRVDIALTTGMLSEVVIYAKPLFDKDQTTSGGTMTADDIKHVAFHNVNQMVATEAGTFSQDGSTPNIKGQRSDGTIYFVDGVRVIGSLAVPQSSIEQLSVLTGGIPAEYGDATGGVISITTKGPSKTFTGGFDGLTSEFLDPYGYNNIDFNLSGPLWMRHKGTDSARPILGFFIAGNYQNIKDPNPSAIPIYIVKPDVFSQLEADPLRQNTTTTTNSYIPNAEFVTMNDLTTSGIKPNTALQDYDFTGKFDIQPSDNINITLGGQVTHSDANAYIYQFSMFDYNQNPEVINNTYRGYVNFRQSFKSSPNAAVKNAFYSVHFDYTNSNSVTQDPNHKTNFFDYGYLGQFKEYREPVYSQQYDTIHGQPLITHNLLGYADTLITFSPGTQNPVAANYTEDYFNANHNRVGPGIGVGQLTGIQNQGGLLNGGSPQIVYSLWNDVGTGYGAYSKSQAETYNLYLTGGVSIKKHDLTFGIQYEQDIDRGYSLSASGLWGLMRQLVNFAVPGTVDNTKPQPAYDSAGNFTNYVNYPLLIADSAQSTFSKNFKSFLQSKNLVNASGQPVNMNGPYVYNIDQYTPKDFSLNMFSADNLLNNGNSLVSYYGYDYLGNKTSGKITYNDFYNSSNRLIAPFSPTYIAGYIEDKFEFKDLICRLGLRVDRYDGNEDVLVDPWSLYPTHTASEVSKLGSGLGVVPGNIGGNYVVYVDNPYNPTKITGYRNGNTWYDASGNEISDPSVIANQSTSSATVTPWLVATNKSQAVLSDASFTAYVPQISVMPRISFSFPISEEAVFYANYDVLTQRPKNGNLSTIDDYFYIEERATNTIANPDLKPSERINYEVGFKQKITLTSAISLQAFYGEMKNMEQIIAYNYAYPISYTTFGNVDFGTVKGFMATYDLRRPGSSGVELQVNYTLQFADGTGSDAVSQGALISAGEPNLKTPFPLDYDVRHQIVGTLDYRFGEGADYTGPVGTWGRKIFENAGINLIGSGRSGTPYSAQANATEAVAIGIAQRTTQLGGINASRLPWQFRLDATADKQFNIARHSKKDQAKQKASQPIICDAYLTVQNVLNTLNVIGVYRYTGSPSDDGFLNSTLGQQTIASADNERAFMDQYSIKANNPGNYSLPRLIRLGLRVNF